jgi:DNA polymerase-1
VARLVVVDAANCLYRAFFAIPSLRASDGFPTNALHGFVNMLRKVIREEQPDALAVCFDPRGKSFRHELYPDYKATRESQPEDLSAQMPVAREIVEAMRIPILEVEGYEADDVIATLATRADEGDEVVIVSTDKDLMQLVSKRVVLLDTMKDKRIGPAGVEARFGVPPSQVLDLRALVGDPSDNIPGVKGIGEKGAAKLLAEWNDLENLLAHAGEVPAKRAREALQEHAEAARLSRRLATLHTDVELPEQDLALGEPDREALAAIFRRLDFTRLLEELEAGAESSAPAAEVRTEIVSTSTQLDELVKRLAEADPIVLTGVGVDEPGGLPAAPAGLAFALGPDEAAYLPLEAPADAAPPLGEAATFEALGPLLSAARGRTWLARDTKRIQSLFAERGGETGLPDFDVEIAAFLVDPAGQHTTAALATQHLDRRPRPWEDLAGRGARATPAAALPVAEVAAWAGEEVCVLGALVAPLRAALERDGLLPLFEEVELPLTAVLARMERDGVRVDEAALEALSTEFEGELARLEARIHQLAGESFAVSSPKQLQHILFDKLGLAPVKKTKTGFSTDESVLEQLAAEHELPALVLEHRRLAKLKSTYVDALPPLVNPATGRIHPSFRQTGAATGRLSCSNPNVQNIPIRSENGSRIREAFVPAEGRRLLSADYSQIELRILAHYSQDQSLRAAFRAGEDIHRRTAAEVAGIEPAEVHGDQRARAKAVNFGIIYGLSPFGLARQLGIPPAEAQATIEAYFARYRGVRAFLDETVERARKDGFVTTLLGRRRYLPDLGSRNRTLRAAAERMAVNSVIQGTAADLIKKAMVEVANALAEQALPAQMILQVHDELVFEAPGSALEAVTALVKGRMEAVYSLDVPLVVDVGVGANWREAH